MDAGMPGTDARPSDAGGGAGTGGGAATTTIATGLSAPRDLAFNLRVPKELWVLSSGDNSVTIVHNAPDDSRRAERRRDEANSHFMAKPMAIAFGADTVNTNARSNPVRAPGTFATCGDFRGSGDFMGPVLWPSSLDYFATVNGQLGSHIDMLHLSPLCTGMAWHGQGHIYWTIAGTTKSIVKYDFHDDHGSGNDDHSDGEIWRYAVGQIGYVAGMPSGLVYRPEDKSLYIADTGNGRVAKLATEGGSMGARMRCLDPVKTCVEMVNAPLTDLVPAGVVMKPTGLEIQGSSLLVADNATSTIHRFTLTGQAQGEIKLALPPGSVGGITVGPDGKVYLVDMIGNRVLRVESAIE